MLCESLCESKEIVEIGVNLRKLGKESLGRMKNAGRSSSPPRGRAMRVAASCGALVSAEGVFEVLVVLEGACAFAEAGVGPDEPESGDQGLRFRAVGAGGVGRQRTPFTGTMARAPATANRAATK